MKKIILLILILPIFIFAQNEECAFVPTADFFNLNNFSRTVRSTFDDDEPYILNVKFHVVDGDDALPVTEDQILNQVAKLNINFNQFNIFFKYKGYDQIYNNDFDVLQIADFQALKDHFIDLNLYDENAMNIFILVSPSYAASTDCVLHVNTVIRNNSTNVIHEIGHSLGLLHIFSGSQWTRQLINDTDPCGNAADTHYITNLNIYAENITRDVNDPNYNADIAGDVVTDTDAFYKNAPSNGCWETNGYAYYPHPELVDNVGEMYFETYDLDDEFFNFMSYGYSLDNFSNGQGVRMRERIGNDTYGNYTPLLNITSDGNPDISVLYEPYKVEEIETLSDEIISLTDNGDGTAEVCRLKTTTLKYYFQPGFDYDFYGYGITNFDHHADKYDLPGIVDTGYYKFLKINQINSNWINNISFSDYILASSDPTNGIVMYEGSVCYRPTTVCVTETYDNGKVVSTTNLANPNPTIKVLNNQEASDPNLEQNLENNKFHIIEKTTTSGAKIKKTIYKDGN